MLERLSRQRIGLLGWGREGRSVARVLTRLQPGVDLTVWVEDGAVSDRLPSIRAPLGDQLDRFEVLIRSPGIPVDHPALARFRKAGGEVVNPSSIWLAERPEVPVIGVTGSKGKSTTAALLAHLLSAGGRKVLLAGNIGVPLLDHLDSDAELVVAEWSSYQLADLAGSLKAGLITRLFAEHVDWHGSVERYFAAKLRMIELLGGNPLVINADDPLLAARTAGAPGRIAGNAPPRIHRRDDELFNGTESFIGSADIHLTGRHNLDNAALALEMARLEGLEPDGLRDALASFRPLPHRLEPVATVNDVRFVNDSIATTPHATRAALEALQADAVTLIAGGNRRPAEWQPVIDWCRQTRLRALIALPDNGGEIAAELEAAGVLDPGSIQVAEDLDQAVSRAARCAGAGGVVLLSPGAPSFPHFRDFEERGERFRAAVGRLADG